MGRILFVVTSDPGHINPCIGPARNLQDEGYDVAFFAPKDISEQLSYAGFNRYFFAEHVPYVRLDAARSEKLSENLRKREFAKRWLKATLLDNVQGRVEELLNAVRDFEPDILVVSPLAYEGAIVGEKIRVPWITLSASMAPFVPDLLAGELSDHCATWLDERNKLFESNGVQANFCLSFVVSPHLNLAMTTNEMIGNRVNPEFRRVGPSIAPGERGDEQQDFPWDRINDRVPLVYMSLGADTYNQTEALKNVFDAVDRRQVQLVVSCGSLALNKVETLNYVPPNVLVCTYAPQLTVLGASSAFITHGGATSVMESLYFGVPMLVSPVWHDQSFQAHFLEKQSLGIRCDLNKTLPGIIWKHLDGLLYAKKYKEPMEKMHKSYKRTEGASEIVRQIQHVMTRTGV